MGLRYLWIDRYCVDQNSNTKHTIIQRMDAIYLGAEFTIVNAAGQGSNCSLPGVTCPRRLTSVTMGGVTITDIPDIRNEIRTSPWSVNYQQLLFFQCWASAGSDILPQKPVLSQPSSKLHLGFDRHLQAFDYGNPVINVSIEDLMRNYLARQISYDKDILNAVIAVISRIGAHFWGLPFQAGGPSTSLRSTNIPNLHNALMWQPVYNKSSSKTCRRPEFPSWSWTGWSGLTGINTTPSLSRPKSDLDPLVRIGIKESCSDRILSLSQYVMEMTQPQADMYRYDPALQIEGWITHVRLRPNCKFGDLRDDEIEVHDSKNEILVAKACVFVNTKLDDQQSNCSRLYDHLWPCLLLDTGIKPGMEAPLGLILKSTEGNRFERLEVLTGCLTLKEPHDPGVKKASEVPFDVVCLDQEPSTRTSRIGFMQSWTWRESGQDIMFERQRIQLV
ncbi:hypothetical protein NX059_002765 [Plenodomus lindquistii]|nr:hypothetical protein NX059_002765 [Plenodomus lindquistii]